LTDGRPCGELHGVKLMFRAAFVERKSEIEQLLKNERIVIVVNQCSQFK
jgi:hypothetical protein